MTAWSDLATKGYVVAPGFLSADEVAILVDEFRAVSSTETLNPNFDGLRFITGGTRARFAQKLVDAARNAGTTMDHVRVGIFYSTTLGVEFGWHTDTSSYYVNPSFLNFWIPLVKPDRARSGLGVIDAEAFAVRCPEIASELRGRAAIRVVVRTDRTVFHDSDRLRYFEVPDPDLMDELAVTPELGPGDLLLMRSDVFHRTQDTDTERLAISFRAVDSTSTVTRQMLANMGPAKFNNMARMRAQFARRFATFEIAGRDALTVREYDAIYLALEAREIDACRRLGVSELTNHQLEELIDELAVESVVGS